MYRKWLMLSFAGIGLCWMMSTAAPPAAPANSPLSRSVAEFGAAGDGEADDTTAIQQALGSGVGLVEFPKGIYRISRTIDIDLDKTGYVSLAGNGVAQIVMTGPGPAFRFRGTHAGTAAPRTFQENVWKSQRTPLVDGLEIVGQHPEASGLEANGTMQWTVTRVVVRKALHGIRLTGHNRNVILSECHLYENRGIGVYLDEVNLHQINISNCHISYNAGGGVVVRRSELRNLQIGTCDIEANMGGPDSEPTANVLLDGSEGSIAEVAIVGCTVQHSHDAPDSANIRIDGRSTGRRYTDEVRFGNITIADNIFSDVQVNVDLRQVRGVTITGNTFWQGYTRNLRIEGSANVVIADNVFDRNPLYHYSDGQQARLGVEIADSQDCTISSNHLYGIGDSPAAFIVRRCRRLNITGCTILDCAPVGLLLEEVSDSRISDCLIRDDRAGTQGESLVMEGGRGNLLSGNLLGKAPQIRNSTATESGNVHP